MASKLNKSEGKWHIVNIHEQSCIFCHVKLHTPLLLLLTQFTLRLRLVLSTDKVSWHLNAIITINCSGPSNVKMYIQPEAL